MNKITVRRMRFEYPADLDAIFIEGEPEESYQNIALSLLLPYLEPYLIRTMRSARAHVKVPALADDLDKFVEQEGQHYRQHARFNAIFRDRVAGLEELERELDDDYHRFSKTKSLRFNLAYAEGFEAFTAAMACVFAEQDRSKWNPVVLDLFSWHLIEELEHRTVAFDVYQHVSGNYPYRLAVGLFAQKHLLHFVGRATGRLLRGDPRVAEGYGGRTGREERNRRLKRVFVRELLPRVLKTYSPWYDPRDIHVPEDVEKLTTHYTEQATKVS